MNILQTLLEITIYSAALFIGIILFRILLKKHMSPVMLYAVWFLLIARLLVPITWDAGFHIFTAPSQTQAVDISALLDGLNHDVTLNQSGVMPLQQNSNEILASEDTHSQSQNETSITTESASVAQTPFSWDTVLIALWLLGVSLLLTLIAVSSIRLRRRIRRSLDDVPPEWRQMAQQIACDLHIRRKIHIAVVGGFPTPALSAGPRPVVVLPKELDNEEPVRFALRHELTHLKRGDHIVCLLMLILRAVYWFNPIVWASVKLMRLDMETACDSMVTRQMSAGSKTLYAQAILSMHLKPQVRYALGMALGSTKKTVERRIKGIFMRSKTGHKARFVALLLTAVMTVACFTTACQPTPELPVVVGKDQSEMIEKAQGQSAEESPQAVISVPLTKQVDAPQTYSTDVSAADGNLIINASEAPVIVPDADRMPMYRVKAADFTQEQVSKMIDTLFEGQRIYEVEYGPETKDDIMERLINVKQIDKENMEAMGWDENRLKEVIADLEKEYEAAPAEDQDVVTESDGLLKREELLGREGAHLAYYDALSVTTNYEDYEKAASFLAENNNDMTEPDMHVDTDEDGNVVGMSGWGIDRRATMRYENSGDAFGSNFGQNPAIRVDEDTVIDDEEVLEKLKITPAEAKRLVEEFLEKAGIKMSVCAMYLLDDENLGGYDGLISPAEHYVYKLYLCRVIDDLRVAYLCGASSARRDPALDELEETAADGISAAEYDFLGSWSYETAEAMVNDDGLISFDWAAPIDIEEKVVDKANLMPFEDIAKRFEEQMRIEYKASAVDDFFFSMTWTVDHVCLELQRIAEQNSFEDGLLVPVWNFYGYCSAITEKGEDWGESFLSGDGIYHYPLMTINAIDGSVISAEVGY